MTHPWSSEVVHDQSFNNAGYIRSMISSFVVHGRAGHVHTMSDCRGMSGTLINTLQLNLCVRNTRALHGGNTARAIFGFLVAVQGGRKPPFGCEASLLNFQHAAGTTNERLLWFH